MTYKSIINAVGFAAVCAAVLLAGCGNKGGKGEQADAADTSAASAPDTAATAAIAAAETNAATFVDSRDGKKYRTVKIGEQTWMAENLNFNADSSKCYDNDAANCDKYGRMYNWETAMAACPKGWHLPGNEEWMMLMDFAGGSETTAGKLKSTDGWNWSNGKDEYGFSALPGGLNASGKFSGIGSMGLWWSATEYDAKNALRYIMDGSHGNAEKFQNEKTRLISIRCVEGAKSPLEEMIIKTVKAYQNKDEKILNELIIRDFGIAYIYRPGIYDFFTKSKKISFSETLPDHWVLGEIAIAESDYKVHFEALPYSECDGEMWNKPHGIYCDTRTTYGTLSYLAKRDNEFGFQERSAAEIKKLKEIEKRSHRVTVIDKGGGYFTFHVTFWQDKWYLIIIDRNEQCSA